MVKRFINLVRKARYPLIGLAFMVALGTAGALALTQTSQTASAQTCDKVNIVYCGLSGSGDSGNVASFKHYYNTGTDGRYHDLKAVYNWSGASSSSVSHMNTSNTKLGTMNNHGVITVNGKTVGTNAKMAARFRDSSWTGVVHVEGNVYARTVTPASTDHNSYPVLVHFNSNGVADFAVATTCGNAVKFTPVVPKPELVCKNLTASLVNRDNRTYQFTATASAKHTTITSYKFSFGDSKSATVKTSHTSASVRHSYAQGGKTFTARVFVNSTRKSDITSGNCVVKVKTPTPPAPKPSLVCTGLTASIVADQDNTYKFTGTAQAKNTTITSYVFDFGDSKTQTVNTSSSSANATHTYTQAGATFTAKVTVNSKDIKNQTAAKCTVTVKTPKVPEAPQLICESLNFNSVASQANTYTFTAKASAKNTTITSYVFDFGDSKTQTVNTANTTATATHTYATNSQDFTATVTVNSKDLSGVTSETCKVTIPKVEVCQPCTNETESGSTNCTSQTNENSEQCQPHVLGTSTTTPPTVLPNTGAGNIIGFFGATTIAGGLLHRFFLRRKVA